MNLARRTWLKIACLALSGAWLGTFPLAGTAHAQSEPVTIFAAASLKNALDAVAADWQKETGKTTRISYAASSGLAKQIEAGAPADIFISADLDWMDYAASHKLLQEQSRFNFLGNRLVLIAPKDNAKPVDIKKGFDLAGLLKGGRLAMGNVASVPAGKYGKAALESLQVWSDVEAAVVQSENVRAALVLVARGEAPYGIVYATDARSEAGVTVVGTFPAESHPPIVYPAALLTGADDAADQAFFAYLTSAAGAAHFRDQGFLVLE
ncbi:MAG: molybdate ABC transporter substrate-binding protein [Rhizobiales bacterium 17-65-6]|nr:MAG: molybdate ABC transporter substrate-binding protein [Rhizobiales bacterium 17-65-6]